MEVEVEYWIIAFGYLYSTVVAAVIISPVSSALWEGIHRERPNSWQPVLVGILERVLFVTSFQIDQPAFVGIWLVLKAAGNWSAWHDDDRSTFQSFLLGNGLSILYALTGSLFIDWLRLGKLDAVFLVFMATNFGIFIIYCWAKIEAKKADREKNLTIKKRKPPKK